MPVITKLEYQKHNKERVSVFVDGEYAFSLTGELALAHALKPGMDVNALPLEEMFQEDAYRQTLSAAFRHLAGQDKTERQMRQFLAQKTEDEATADRVLSKLKDMGYINDRAYAENFVAGCSHTGVYAMRSKLLARGVPEDIVQEVLAGCDEGQQYSAARHEAEKYIKKLSACEGFQKKQKLSRHLAQHGFSWDVISEVCEALLSEDEV